MNSKIFLIFYLFLLFSCEKKDILLSSKDAALFSNFPQKNISGKNYDDNFGLGAIKKIDNQALTYPAMYLGSGGADSVKDAFVVGGFDLKRIKKNIKSAKFKFYINYSSSTLKNVIIFVRPILEEWDEQSVNYFSFYQSDESGSYLRTNVERNESLCKLIVFDVKRNEDRDFSVIPYPNSYRVVSIDVTSIVKQWVENSNTNFGLLIDPMWKTDLRYCTVNNSNELSDFGIIEIATSEWLYWNKNSSKNLSEKWLLAKNKALGRVKFVPRIEVIYSD